MKKGFEFGANIGSQETPDSPEYAIQSDDVAYPEEEQVLNSSSTSFSQNSDQDPSSPEPEYGPEEELPEEEDFFEMKNYSNFSAENKAGWSLSFNQKKALFIKSLLLQRK